MSNLYVAVLARLILKQVENPQEVETTIINILDFLDAVYFLGIPQTVLGIEVLVFELGNGIETLT